MARKEKKEKKEKNEIFYNILTVGLFMFCEYILSIRR